MKQIKNINSKQTFNLAFSIISTNKSWKQLTQTKLKNNIRQILYLGEQFVDNKLVITTDLQKICFDLSKDADNSLEHEIYSIIKHDELLAEHTIKNEVRQLFSKYKHGYGIHEHGKQ